MAPRLILCLATLLAGCSSLLSSSTDDALELQRNALQAYDGGEDARAESLYLGLTRISPNDPETWLRLGNLYARSGRAEHAADAYQRALLLDPNDARAWYNLGVIRQRQTQAAYIQAAQLTKPGDLIHERSEQLARQFAPPTDNTAPADENPPARQ